MAIDARLHRRLAEYKPPLALEGVHTSLQRYALGVCFPCDRSLIKPISREPQEKMIGTAAPSCDIFFCNTRKKSILRLEYSIFRYPCFFGDTC